MRKQRDVLDVEEPVARISGRRLIVAVCVTLIALPLLVFGLPGGSSASIDASDPSAELASSQALPKGVSLAPTERTPTDSESIEESPVSAASVPSTPTTRSIAPTTTVTTVDPDVTDTPPPPPAPEQSAESGQASWSDLPTGTCLHRTAAFESVVRVTNTTTGASTTCIVTARGPYVAGRVIELERSVFAEIAPTNAGLVTVRVEW